jgi:hypothetical protein
MFTAMFITSPRDWRLRAACRGDDGGIDRDVAEAFFPVATNTHVDGEHTAAFVAQAQPALRMCAGCPVRMDCLQAALNSPTPHKDLDAVVGGTLPGQRAKLRQALAQLADADDEDADEAVAEMDVLSLFAAA